MQHGNAEELHHETVPTGRRKAAEPAECDLESQFKHVEGDSLRSLREELEKEKACRAQFEVKFEVLEQRYTDIEADMMRARDQVEKKQIEIEQLQAELKIEREERAMKEANPQSDESSKLEIARLFAEFERERASMAMH